MTTGEVCRRLGCWPWQIITAINRGLLDAPERLGRFYVWPPDRLEEVRRVMTEAGYLKP